MTIRIRFTNTNTGANLQGIRVYRSQSSFTSANLPEVYANLRPNVTEFVDADVEFDQTYYYMFGLWRLDVTEEVIYSALITARAFPNSGAGATALVQGDLWYGYYGEVTAANFINGDALASALSLTDGGSINTNSAWLKVAHRNRTLFVPKLPLRQNVSYDQLRDANLIAGMREVTIAGQTYRVRLLRGTNVNPAQAGASVDPLQAHGSEWNEVFYPVFSGATPSQLVDNWANNAIAALGTIPCWTQELVDGGAAIARGNATTVAQCNSLPTGTTTGVAWRPCLELVV